MKHLVVGLALLTACTTTTRQDEPPSAPQVSTPAPTPPSTIYVFEGVEVFGSREVPQEKLVVLVAMAGMQQKIDHEPARKVLAMLAGQDFGGDVAAWRRWLEQQR